MKLILIGLMAVIVFGSVGARAEDGCEVNDGAGSFDQLQAMIRNPLCKIKSVDDVVAKLPLEMRNRVNLFYKSESLQGPHETDYLHPRAILRTAYGAKQLYVTFNGEASQPGYRELEVLDVDQKAAGAEVFKYYAIKFPKDAAAKDLTWADAQAKIQVSPANSARCTACHGIPARPIYATYPMWPGSFGSRTNTVDKIEQDQFKLFIAAKTADPTSRYRNILIPPAGKDPYAFDGMYTTLLSGHEHSDKDLSFANSVRVAKLARATPQYDQFKYALVGAFLNCGNYESFFPPAVNKSLRARLRTDFQLEPRVDSAKIHATLKEFWKAGPNQFGNFRFFKVELEFDQFGMPTTPKPVLYSEFFKRTAGLWDNSGFLVDLFADTLAHQGAERAAPIATKLRYVTEGRGINISNWFLDLKQPAYRMMVGVDGGEHFLNGILENESGLDEVKAALPIIRRDTNGQGAVTRAAVCKPLAERSRAALSQITVTQLPEKAAIAVSVYPQTFLNTCTLCHVEQKIGPRIPYHDPAAFNQWLKVGQNSERILYRLNGPVDQRMPLNRVLSEQERKELTTYIEQNR